LHFLCDDTYWLTRGLDSALQIYDRIMTGDMSAQSLCAPTVIIVIIDNIQEMLDNKKAELRECHTGKLWVQYMKMVNLVRQLIRTERTGHWAPLADPPAYAIIIMLQQDTTCMLSLCMSTFTRCYTFQRLTLIRCVHTPYVRLPCCPWE